MPAEFGLVVEYVVRNRETAYHGVFCLLYTTHLRRTIGSASGIGLPMLGDDQLPQHEICK